MGSKMNVYERVSLSVMILKFIWFLFKVSFLIMSGYCLMLIFVVTQNIELTVNNQTLFELFFYAALISGVIYLVIWAIVKDSKKALTYHVILGVIVLIFTSIFLQQYK